MRCWLIVAAGCGGELGSDEENPAGADPTALAGDPAVGDTGLPVDSQPEGPSEARFEIALNGSRWTARTGGHLLDPIGDLMLSATRGDEDIDLFVLGSRIDGPGRYVVTDAAYWRTDDPLSAIGTWSAAEDPGQLELELLAVGDRMHARWTGNVVLHGYERDGAEATWTLGDGEATGWPDVYAR